MSSKRYDPPIQYERIRRELRRTETLLQRDVALHMNDGSVRSTLLMTAFDEYDELPDAATQIYDPVEHAIIIDLPDPKAKQSSVKDF